MTASLTSSAAARVRSEEISLIGVLNVFLRRLPLIVGCGVLLAGAVTLSVLRKPDKYTTSVSFIPGGATQPQGISGLAAQFGIAVPSASGALSPNFYLDLLKSRVILRRVALAQYDIMSDSGRVAGDLMRVFGLTQGTAQARLEGAIGTLWTNITPVVQKNTGAVQVSVSAPFPMLAKQIADHLLEETNAYNLEVRQSQASVERRYAEQRLTEARTELRSAEDRLQAFSEQNRQIMSAQLRLSQERIERDVSMRQQVYISLAQAYEQSRLAEVRDTPTIMVLEPAELPLRPDPRRLGQLAILAFLTGAFVGMLLAFVVEFIAQARDEHDPAMMELEATMGAISSKVRASTQSLRPRGKA